MEQSDNFEKLLEKLRASNYFLENVRYNPKQNILSYLDHKIKVDRRGWVYEICDRNIPVAGGTLKNEKAAVQKFKEITNNFKSLEDHTLGFSFSKKLHMELQELLEKEGIKYTAQEKALSTPAGKLVSYRVQVKLPEKKLADRLKAKYINGNYNFRTRSRCIPMVIHGADIKQIVKIINETKDLVYLVPNEEVRRFIPVTKWKAVHTIDEMKPDMLCLWHTESGPLPVSISDFQVQYVEDPFEGWTCSYESVLTNRLYRTVPRFPVFHTGIFDFRYRKTINREIVRKAALDWMVSDRSDEPIQPEQSTIDLWNTLKDKIEKLSTKVIKEPLLKTDGNEWYCLAEADEYLQGDGNMYIRKNQ